MMAPRTRHKNWAALIAVWSILVLTLGSASLPAAAQSQAASGEGSQDRIMVDLAQDTINVTTGFSGSSVTVFGTVKGLKKDQVVAVLLKGPSARVVVREKKPVMGMWLNSGSVVFKDIPHFYDYALSAGDLGAIPTQALIDNGIGLDTLVFDTEDRDDRTDNGRYKMFQEALIRNWQKSGNLPLGPKKVKALDDNFFRADFDLPANIPTGAYTVEAFLFEGGKLVDKQQRLLDVHQAGFSASISYYARHNEFLYALAGFLMAVSVGLLSATLARRGK